MKNTTYKNQILKSLKNSKKNNETRNLTLKMEISLIESFKKDCDKEGLSMSEVIKALIKKYLGQED